MLQKEKVQFDTSAFNITQKRKQFGSWNRECSCSGYEHLGNFYKKRVIVTENALS